MKTPKLLLGVLVALFSTAGFLSCTKTDTVIKTDTVKVPTYLARTTLTLSATKDASIFLQDPIGNTSLADNGSGASDLLRVGYSDKGYYVRSLVAFDVSTVPKTAVIDEVILSFTIGKSGNNMANDTVSVYKVTQTWSEGTTDDLCEYANYYCSQAGTAIVSGGGATWNSATNGTTAWTTAGGTFASSASATNINGGVPSFSSAGLIADVMAWRDTPASNNGWLLKAKEGYFQKSGGEQIRYYSREASTTKAGRSNASTTGAEPATKPTLTVIYH